MNRKSLIVPACIVCAGFGALVGSFATAGTGHDAKSDAPEMKLPKGWTPEDMQACIDAGTLGVNHLHLAKAVGTWEGKCTQWMSPDADPVTSECTSTVKTFLDGRYIHSEFNGEIPGFGPFKGFGLQGYDNVSKKFVASWVDNMGTGIMNGTGELSSDGGTLTWTYTVNCPIAKKPVTMKEIQRTTEKAMSFEMHCTDPKSGKQFKSMTLELHRKG